MHATEVHVHEYAFAPFAMRAKEAAAYIGESETQFRRLVGIYPDRLRPFNYLPKGEAKWSRDDLEAFVGWRKAIGVERVG